MKRYELFLLSLVGFALAAVWIYGAWQFGEFTEGTAFEQSVGWYTFLINDMVAAAAFLVGALYALYCALRED